MIKHINELKTWLETKIIGQESLVERLIIALLSDGHVLVEGAPGLAKTKACLLYTSPSPRDRQKSRMPSSA